MALACLALTIPSLAITAPVSLRLRGIAEPGVLASRLRLTRGGWLVLSPGRLHLAGRHWELMYSEVGPSTEFPSVLP